MESRALAAVSAAVSLAAVLLAPALPVSCLHQPCASGHSRSGTEEGTARKEAKAHANPFLASFTVR